MELKLGNENFQRAASCFIRMEVFVLERNIPLAEEFDNLDTPERVYAVVYDENLPVATGRIVIEDEKTIRPTRIATLKAYRKQNLGAKIMKAIEAYGVKNGYIHSLVHAEQTAVGFYQKLGYKICSDIYYEDGVPCQSLEKALV
ncbi:GNAT family N-acetyltransferase [Enterococcus sp. MJM12]|uniref:GNAT family N-acetyltransferase n=1 Tax=Candidatus Enterococcus myersii TaxID=2815322 RepID=A0ABS3H765_9ENTE|nr:MULTISPECIES: GNAT family N-acetyltransferase [Enterococcus]MBO0448844.1 GNAT family N-acetyltransferase [Enterococcus sp. MJM12]MCD1024400.1 GNAT family N-acetyltransferase [Enterococcus sp. SMC-9]MDT2739895.1 GNAT family N-acetyltransferase [Enterococcus canintestini]